MSNKKLKKVSLDTMIDRHIGEKGTVSRTAFEYKLKLDVMGELIKRARKERGLTQTELGELVGVKKAQISRIENQASNVTMGTLLRVFDALQASITLKVELPDESFEIAS